MKPLLVGEANPYGADPYYALYCEPPTSAGGRLCRKVLGLEPREYLSRFDRANLCVGKWDVCMARSRAHELTRAPVEHSHFVLLGAKVTRAFDVEFRPFTAHGMFVVLPHPSGLCRAWSEPGAFERARAVLREAGVL